MGTPDPVTGQDMVEHRYREGGLRIPAELAGIVLAVLGLDNRPQARAQFRRAPATSARATAPAPAGPSPGGPVPGAPAPGAPAPGGAAPAPTAAPAAAATSYTPPQVATLYQFPAGTDGTGQTIAIIELGGGFGSSDLDPYFAGLGLAVPSVTAASVDGAVNQPGQDPSGADGEVLLDIEVAGAVAPGAAQVVYFAPNTDQGFVDAVTTAVHASPTPAVVSISWGQSEDSWTAQARTALDQALADAAALGVTVCVAAGDNGSGDGQSGTHVDFPASSPHALACGGTSLRGNAGTGVISSETVWNDGASGGATGGGVSDAFGLPSWQAAAGVPARAGAPRRCGGPGGARRGRLRRPGHRLSGPGGRAVHGDRRDERGGPAVGRADQPAGAVHREGVRADPAAPVRGGGRGRGRTGVPRHHQRQQRRLRGRAGLGRLHRARLPGGKHPADQAGLTRPL